MTSDFFVGGMLMASGIYLWTLACVRPEFDFLENNVDTLVNPLLGRGRHRPFFFRRSALRPCRRGSERDDQRRDAVDHGARGLNRFS